MKLRSTLVLLLLLLSGAARASEADVTKLMESYWRAYSRSDFVAAAAYLDPRDTGALKEGLLPLFLRAAESKNVNVVPLVKAFFTGIPADQRENAILGLRKSNASVSVSGNLLNPSTLSPQEMQGLNAVVAAQAYCM